MYIRIGLFLGLGLVGTMAQAASDIAQLYPSKLPQGSAWVRVVNPSDTPQQVQLNNGTRQTFAANAMISSTFQAVDARQPVRLTVNGKEVQGLKAPEGAWVTLILNSDPSAAPRLIIDPPSRGKDLKAEFNFYNLSPGCASAEVKLASGAKVIGPVQADGQAQRTINPVRATLTGHCAQASSTPLMLESFQAGDRYSLFLVGPAQAPRLVGLVDKTAP